MNETVKSFAVDLLGCGCESEVFKSIQLCADPFGKNIAGGRRILIGGKLLIYLVPWDESMARSGTVRYLMGRGKQERDHEGYNRFRLVLAAHRPDALRDEVDAAMHTFIDRDEKLHLHVLDRNNELVTALLR